MSNDLNDERLWKRLLRKMKGKADSQDAEDALHSAYLRLQHYRVDHIVDNAEAFLVRTARNIAIDNFRRRAPLSDRPLEVECAQMSDSAPLQDEVIEARNRLLHVQKGLEQLPLRTRQVFEMHRLDQLKYREIAERLGISQSAVEKHIARAALFLGQWTKGL